MKFTEFISIFCCCLLALSQCQAVIYNCKYSHKNFDLESPLKRISFSGYGCNLKLISETAVGVTEIYGQHKDRMADDDVHYFWIDSNLKTISSIFCQKFKNLEVILAKNVEIWSIDEDGLKDCGKLRVIVLQSNKIRELSQKLISGKSNLTHFHVSDNSLTSLPKKFFISQNQLEELNLEHNQLSYVPSRTLDPLVNLQYLNLANNKLHVLDPEWFVNLRNLKLLILNGNEIFDLPIGIFTPLRSLQELKLSDNKISIIHSDSFGPFDGPINIELYDNKITAVDEKLTDITTVVGLYMKNNLCFDGTVRTANKNEIKEKLRTCFNNYRPRLSQSIGCGISAIANGKIISGTQIVRGAFPWIAALERTNGELLCAGTLISNRKVVTAAHCIQGKNAAEPILASDITFFLGVHDLSDQKEEGRAAFEVESVHIHPEWNSSAENYDADIAVLVLDQEVTFGRSIQPICLIDPTATVPPISNGYVVSFGRNIPNVVGIPIYSMKDCFHNNTHIETVQSDSSFYGQNSIKLSENDSGSGFFVPYAGVFYLHGIVSASMYDKANKCGIDRYEVFTDIKEYTEWVMDIQVSEKSGNSRVEIPIFSCILAVFVNLFL